MANEINTLAPPKSKSQLAKRLGISRSALYYLPKLPRKDMELKNKIERVLVAHKAYGHRRIAIALGINKKRVFRVMKLFNIKTKRRRKYPRKPKDIKKAPMAIPNLLLDLEIIINAPNKVWATDFTYLPYLGKFIYLATVEDLYTRLIVGWEVSVRHNADLVTQALINAFKRYPKPHIVHSDQGSEYTSQEYLELAGKQNIKVSMSEKASPWQNGFQESFYSGFKLELGYPEAYPTAGELIEAIANQIYYYNHKRIHSALKCPPAVFSQRCQQIKTKITF